MQCGRAPICILDPMDFAILLLIPYACEPRNDISDQQASLQPLNSEDVPLTVLPIQEPI